MEGPNAGGELLGTRTTFAIPLATGAHSGPAD